MEKMTQEQRIIDYLNKHGKITQFEAMNRLGVIRLASRVSSLKKKGFPIKSEYKTVKNRFKEKCLIKEYSLEKGA